MPVGIFLYEIVPDFGSQIIADFYTGKEKVSGDALKEFIEKHTKKGLVDATYKENDLKYYSSVIKAENIAKTLYLGFVLKEDEDLISLKSMFEKIEQQIAQNYSPDKRKMQLLLKDIIGSIMSLMEKLQEPRIIQEKINEKTKALLDEGKIQEARVLMDLGDTIPKQLSAAVKQAEQFMKQENYKKAKKSYLIAADLSKGIDEQEMVNILNKKAEQCDNIPLFIKDREIINREIKKSLSEMEKLNLAFYDTVVPSIEKSIKISNSLEDNPSIEVLSELKYLCLEATNKAKELLKFDAEIKEKLKKL